MRTLVAAIIALLALGCGGAQVGSLAVADAQYRPPLVDGGVGVAYFSITSSAPDRIVAVSSPQATAVEIHESASAAGMAEMKMRASVELPAGKAVIFGPGGLHLMVIGPKLLAPNATFPIQIELESGRKEIVAFSGVPAPHSSQ